MVQQGVDQCAVGVTRGGMHHHTHGFIDHDDISVLVHDVQGNVPGGNIHGLCLGNGKLHPVPGIQAVILPAGSAVEGDLALLNELLGGGAGQAGAPGQKRVQTLPGDVSGEGHFFSSFQKDLFRKNRCAIRAMQPQVMKQSATLNTGKSMNSVSIMSTTYPRRSRSIMFPTPPP